MAPIYTPNIAAEEAKGWLSNAFSGDLYLWSYAYKAEFNTHFRWAFTQPDADAKTSWTQGFDGFFTTVYGQEGLAGRVKQQFEEAVDNWAVVQTSGSLTRPRNIFFTETRPKS